MDSGPSGVSDEPTVASVLGIKGQLRFHPHGSTQKAHVVLRRIELSEESDDEGDSSMIYFSLFAQKRIEVKPGKEILLAVATPDGRFLETPVVFAGKVSGEDDPVQGISPHHLNIEVPVKIRPPVIPPKLRKPWLAVPSIDPPPSPPKARPTFASVAIQAEPDDSVPEVNMKLDTTPLSSNESVHPLQDDAINLPVTAPSSEVSVEEQLESSSDRERSLSPMELDSRSSSPAPPGQLTGANDDRQKSKSFSPPGLSVPVPSTQQQTLPETSPSHAKETLPRPSSSTPDSDDPPGLSLPPLPSAPSSPSLSKVGKHDATTTPSKQQPTSPIRSTASVGMSLSPRNSRQEKMDTTVDTNVTPSHPVQSPVDPVVAATPYVPKRKTVPNPFVSGGLITDFVGKLPPGKAIPQSTLGSQPSTPSTTEATSSITLAPSVAASTKVSPMPSTPSRSSPGGSSIRSSPRSPTPGRSPLQHRRAMPSPPSSPASSSKVKIEDVPMLSSIPQPSSPPSIALSQFVTRPPPPPPHAIPPPPRRSRFLNTTSTGSASLATIDTHRPVDNGIVIPTQPPPDYKSIAYVAEGSYSNPLGIRPARTNGWKSNKPLPPQISTSAPPKGGSKKPVAIGSGWPYNRQANGNNPRGTGGRRASFQNGAVVPPPTSVSPSEQMYSSTFVAPIGGPFGDSSAPNGLANGAANDPLHDAPSPAQMHNTRTSIPATPSSIVLSDPGNSPTTVVPNLPNKPQAFTGPTQAWDPSRGVKRMGSPSPPNQDPRRQRTFKWPTSNGLHSVKLKGDDDVGIRSISHSSDGSLFAVTCYDKSVRVWSSKTRAEIAKLAHNMQIVDVAWMDRDAGIVTLGENGIISTWTRSAASKWQWAKILDANAAGERRAEDSPCCLAFCRDRLAVAYPRSGVKIWLFVKGTWSPQRSIVRQNVTAVKFIEDGEGLIGGTTDGVLWHCAVPNGTLRAYAFMRTKISALDVDFKGSHALAAQTAGCILVNIANGDNKGNVEQAYSVKDPELLSTASYGFGALFASRGASLLFGLFQGCIMVWDRASGNIVHGLYLGEEHSVQAVASFDGGQAFDGHVLVGTRQGQLTWFSQPPAEARGSLA